LRVLERFLARRVPFGLAGGETVSSAGQLLDGAALFELGEHFKEGAIVGLFQVEALGDFGGGRGGGPNLQKTQDVIGAQV
jgi:hypothetical protein